MAEQKSVPETKLSKNDFVELEYTGRIKDNGVFDTNIKEEAKKLNLEIESKPLVICLGQNMLLPAIDEFLIGKTTGDYTLSLEPEKAFGYRRRELVKIMPSSVFKNSDILPKPGMVFVFDNLPGKITAISGGRVIVDFNSPLAGKELIYDLKAKRTITEEKEKTSSLIQAFFKMPLEFKIEGIKLVVEAEEKLKPFIELYKPKFKEILNLELEVKITEKKKEAVKNGL